MNDLNLEKDINDKYQVKLDEIDKNYETIYSDIDTKYKNLESEISKKIINVNVAKNKEFYRNGLSKKFYELSDEWSNLQNEKGSLTSKKSEEKFETDIINAIGEDKFQILKQCLSENWFQK